MRDTREVPIPGGSIATIDTGTTKSPLTVLPFGCEVVGVAWWCDKLIDVAGDADHTFDVFLNGSDVGIDLHIKDGVAQGIGYFDAEFFAAAGDGIQLLSNNDQFTALSAGYFTYIVKQG